MRTMNRILGFTFFLVACGSSSKVAPTPTAAASAPTDAKSEQHDAGTPSSAPSSSASSGVPMSCASQDGNVCLPDPGFVKRACNGAYPDVALLLFSKDAPFTRVYLRSDID